MKFNEILEINGVKTFKIDEYISGNEDIIIYDVLDGVPTSMFNSLVDYVLNENGKIDNFDEDRNINSSIYSSYICIEYSDKNLMEKDKKLMKENLVWENPIKTKKYSEEQIGEPVGSFEYGGKYYQVIYYCHLLTDETNSETGIYKGIIVNPELYFGLNERTNNEVRESVKKIDNIL